MVLCGRFPPVHLTFSNYSFAIRFFQVVEVTTQDDVGGIEASSLNCFHIDTLSFEERAAYTLMIIRFSLFGIWRVTN